MKYNSPLLRSPGAKDLQSDLGGSFMALRYWIGLNIADAALTGLALALGTAEANPVLRLFAAQLGYLGMLFVKGLFAISVGGVLWQRGKVKMLTVLNVGMLGIVIYNMVVITYTL